MEINILNYIYFLKFMIRLALGYSIGLFIDKINKGTKDGRR